MGPTPNIKLTMNLLINEIPEKSSLR